MLTENLWKTATIILGSILILMSIKYYMLSSDNAKQAVTETNLRKELKDANENLVVANANYTSVSAELEMSNAVVQGMAIDLAVAKKKFKDSSDKINTAIQSQQNAVADLNATEDCKEAKRIADEIINML